MSHMAPADVHHNTGVIERPQRGDEIGHRRGLPIKRDDDGVGRQPGIGERVRLSAQKAFAQEAKQPQSGPGEEHGAKQQFGRRHRRPRHGERGERGQRQISQDHQPARMAHARRQFGMPGAQLVNRTALDFMRAVARDEVVQPRGAGHADALGHLGAGHCDCDQAPAVDQSRRHHDLDAVAV